MNMCGQVLVAQVEPVGAPVDRQFLQSMEGIPANSPPFGRIDNSRQRVRHDVQVRADFQPVQHNVVTGVDNDGQDRGVHHFIKPKQQF